jgi:NAD(P)-dependent dehydrogenase (short-subunit alcohol dehydrogenase family)
MIDRLNKPVVIITGSGSGIGKSLSDKLKQYYDVVGVTRDCYSAKDSIFQCDVGKEKDVIALRDKLDFWLVNRGVDLLINCAGVNKIEYLENLSVKEWDECYSSNVRSVFLMSKYFLPFLTKAKGSICNIGSIAGRQPMRATLPYCSSKAALTMMTRQMAREIYGRHGVSVFELSVGARVIGTEMTKYVRKQVCKVRKWKKEEYDLKDTGLKVDVGDITDLMMNFLKNSDKLWMFNGSIIEIGG